MFTEKPAVQSTTIQGALFALMPLAMALLQRRRPTLSEVVAGAGAATAIYGRVKAGGIRLPW